MNFTLEVIVLPVADVDRAKAFYESLGWRLDADVPGDGGFRVVQLTPPGSPASIIVGSDVTAAAPGSTQGLYLVVDDIEAARAELVDEGVEVSEVFHFEGGFMVTGTKGRVPGPAAGDGSYRSWASFSDPDGNGWLLQQVKTRLPGRGFGLDVPTLTDLLKEAEEHHGAYEAIAPKHHWSGWYAAYVMAREQGSTPEQAVQAAIRNIEGAIESART